MIINYQSIVLCKCIECIWNYLASMELCMFVQVDVLLFQNDTEGIYTVACKYHWVWSNSSCRGR